LPLTSFQVKDSFEFEGNGDVDYGAFGGGSSDDDEEDDDSEQDPEGSETKEVWN
jgi:hypothetical protein